MTQAGEDPFRRIQREWREQCQRWGTYRPVTDQEADRIDRQWREEAARKLAASQAKPRARRRQSRNARPGGT